MMPNESVAFHPSLANPLRLLFVLPAYEPAWEFGGVVRCMSALCRALAALGCEVTVYAINTYSHSNPDEPPHTPIDQGGVRTFFFKPSWGQSVFYSSALVQYLGRTVHDYDLVYLSAIWQYLGAATARICRRAGAPLIVAPHGSLDRLRMQQGRMRKALYYRLILRSELECATALHFTTEYERRESEPWTRSYAPFVVPNALDLSRFQPLPGSRQALRRAWGVADNTPLVMVVGRPDPIKRVDLVLRALALERRVTLAIVGDSRGPIGDRWRVLCTDLDIHDRVVWTGFVHGPDLANTYAAADLLALPSLDENFGMVVIEALACGLPVLATPGVGVWDDIAEDRVGECVPGEPKAIAHSLASLVDDRSAWQARGARGHAIAARFSADRVAAQMILAFQDVLHGTRSPQLRWDHISQSPARNSR